MKIREYSGPLTVFAAGVLGFSLICIVSAAALVNPSAPRASDIGAQDIVDSAFSNPINTAAALTAVEISEYIATPTPTLTLHPTITVSITATNKIFVTWTPLPPTRTRVGRPSATSTRVPSRTPTRILLPSPTNTPVPPTDTSEPPPTDTPVPPTDTPEPPPTDTTPVESPIPQGIPLP